MADTTRPKWELLLEVSAILMSGMVRTSIPAGLKFPEESDAYLAKRAVEMAKALLNELSKD